MKQVKKLSKRLKSRGPMWKKQVQWISINNWTSFETSRQRNDIIQRFEQWWTIGNKSLRIFVENLDKPRCMGSILQNHFHSLLMIQTRLAFQILYPVCLIMSPVVCLGGSCRHKISALPCTPVSRAAIIHSFWPGAVLQNCSSDWKLRLPFWSLQWFQSWSQRTHCLPTLFPQYRIPRCWQSAYSPSLLVAYHGSVGKCSSASYNVPRRLSIRLHPHALLRHSGGLSFLYTLSAECNLIQLIGHALFLHVAAWCLVSQWASHYVGLVLIELILASTAASLQLMVAVVTLYGSPFTVEVAKVVATYICVQLDIVFTPTTVTSLVTCRCATFFLIKIKTTDVAIISPLCSLSLMVWRFDSHLTCTKIITLSFTAGISSAIIHGSSVAWPIYLSSGTV